MSDKLISELEEKTGVVDSDQMAVEGGGVTWRLPLLKLREYLFGIFAVWAGATSKSDFLLLKRFGGDAVYRVSLDNLLPDAVVKTKHLEDSVSADSGITAAKIAPAAVTHPKLAIDSVHTHNIANAEATSFANWTSKDFGTGVTTAKIVDGAVTGAKGGVPVGAVFHFAGSKAPVGYVACNGNLLPAFDANNPGATYTSADNIESIPVWRLQDLRNHLGTQFGVQGKLPDLQGIFVRGSGRNSVATTRVKIKQDNAGTSGNVFWGSSETNEERPSTVSYTIEFYSDANFVTATGSLTYTLAQSLAFSPPHQITGHARKFYMVYANKGAVSGSLGTVQQDAMQQHFHNTIDPRHTHGAEGQWKNTNHSHEIKYNIRNDLQGGGGSQAVNHLGWNGNSTSYTKDIDLGFCGDCVDVSVDSASTGITISRYPNIAFKVPDETRPVNMALLACIKY
jgi:hypothetical protein